MTLVVGLTLATTITPSAFAWKKDGSNNGNTKTIQVLKQNAKSSAFTDSYKKDGHDKYMKGGQDSYKKDGKANGGKDHGSVVEQNGQNVICTHPGSTSPDNACTSQNNGLPPA